MHQVKILKQYEWRLMQW